MDNHFIFAQGGAMDSNYLIEEEVLKKLQKNFSSRFNLDQNLAAELTLEILEIMQVCDSDFHELNSFY